MNPFKRIIPMAVMAAFFTIVLTGCPSVRSLDSAKNSKLKTSGFGDLLSVLMPQDMASQIKDYEGFRLSFNKDNHTANWVAWELLDSEVDGPFSRSDNFWQDAELIGCPNKTDYRGSGFDRGHVCPAADNKLSKKMMEDCFVMSNICPQAHALNSGAWKTLESKEREWVMRDKVLYIVAGPIYEQADKQRIGDTGVRVPSAFFKVMIAPTIEYPRGIGFIYPNMHAPGNMQNYSMTIDEVEKITGLDFFHNLRDDLENEIESRTSFREWNRR